MTWLRWPVELECQAAFEHSECGSGRQAGSSSRVAPWAGFLRPCRPPHFGAHRGLDTSGRAIGMTRRSRIANRAVLLTIAAALAFVFGQRTFSPGVLGCHLSCRQQDRLGSHVRREGKRWRPRLSSGPCRYRAAGSNVATTSRHQVDYGTIETLDGQVLKLDTRTQSRRPAASGVWRRDPRRNEAGAGRDRPASGADDPLGP